VGFFALRPNGMRLASVSNPRAARSIYAVKDDPMSANRVSTKHAVRKKSNGDIVPSKILAIDIGGTKLKFLATGQTEPRKVPSGKKLTPARMVEIIKENASDWEYDALSIGYPGMVGEHGPRSEPGNLGPGWVGFNFAAAFELPVRIMNDAAMQALGSYEGGRMLFLGLGTGLGSALIAEKVIVVLELGQLMGSSGKPLGQVVSRAGLERFGKATWRKEVHHMVLTLTHAFMTDYIVLGGGNAKQIKKVPPGARLGHNLTAFRGGFRLWNVDDVPTLDADGHPETPTPDPVQWRMI
jgi:polyphosphate glucokinase